MIKYCLAFAFDFQGQVALIKKSKPEWQAGRLNGIGGKVEDDETPQQAMEREFCEETGVYIRESEWIHRGSMRGTVGWHVDVFTVQAHAVARVRTMEEELVALYKPEYLLLSRCIENVPALIALCRIPTSAPSNVFPKFVLNY